MGFENLYTLGDIQTVLMLEVKEGMGTEGNPVRMVRYFIDRNGRHLGRIDELMPASRRMTTEPKKAGNG